MRCVGSVMTASFSLFAGSAFGQSAVATLSAPSASVTPGSTITVSLEVSFTSGSASAGAFGSPGLYGFGGTVSASGDAAEDTSASAASVTSLLDFGETSITGSGPSLLTSAGGRGFGGGLADGTITVVSFDVTIDPAASGTVTLAYEGAVVLALDDTLVTYSTDPGTNQQTLAPATLELEIGGGSRLCADVNNDGSITSSDFFAWVNAFGANDTVPCDVNNDTNCNSSDFFAWVNFFGNPASDPGDCLPL